MITFSNRYGTFYYTETEYYEGEWYENKRNGWGRMYYQDGSVYEGRFVEICLFVRLFVCLFVPQPFFWFLCSRVLVFHSFTHSIMFHNT